MRALEARVRASSDEEVADLLTTEEGQWFFVECPRYMAADVAHRVITIVSAGIPEGVFWDLLGVTPERK